MRDFFESETKPSWYWKFILHTSYFILCWEGFFEGGVPHGYLENKAEGRGHKVEEVRKIFIMSVVSYCSWCLI
jgi:hypothetical protein